jgi:phosphatidylinositol glycan class B
VMAGIGALPRPSRVSSADRVGEPTSPIVLRRETWIATAPLLLVAGLSIGLRLIPLVFVPSANWYDEIFQSTEQAHRLVYGYGLVPWEFQLGMRSWLLPGFVAALMELARLFGDGPDYYLPVIDVGFAVLAAAPAVCCFLWCRRWFGPTAGLVSGIAVAVAPELVYFGARALSEVVSAHLLVIGIFLAEPGDEVMARRRLFATGALLGLACLLRVQILPAVAILAVWLMTRSWRTRFPIVLAGAVAALILVAVLDWLTLGYPLASVVRPVLYNLYYGVSSEFGVEPWSYYVLGEIGLWGAAIILLLLVIALGAVRSPALLIAAVSIIAVHSCIAHKEYRFIYPAVILFMLLAGIGLGQLMSWGGEWLNRRGLEKRKTTVLCGLAVVGWWTVLSYQLWTSETMTGLRQRAHDNLAAASFVAHQPAFCGLGLYGEKGRDWARSGGYTYLHRPVPIYWPENRFELSSLAPAFNVLIYTAAPPSILGFEKVRCFGRVCVARRAGDCEAESMAAMPFPDNLAGMAPPKEDFQAIPRQP